MNRSGRIWALVVVSLAAVVLMAPARPSPSRNVSFRVEVEGQAVGFFTSLDGPGLSIEILEFRDGGDPNAVPRKLPGRTTINDVTLKRGYVNRSFFESWIGRVRGGDQDIPKNITIVLLDQHQTEVARYNLYRCWPASWKISTLEDKGNDVVIEEVVIAVEDFEKA